MNETAEKIRSCLGDLKTRQSDIRAESVKIAEAIAALERLLQNPSCTGAGSSAAGVRHGQSSHAACGLAIAFPAESFAGMSQRPAAIELLRKVGQPMSMLDILQTLQRSGFGFRAKSPYHSMFAAMSRAPEIVKRGNTWDLVERAADPGEPPTAVEPPKAHSVVADAAPPADNHELAAKGDASGVW